MSDYMPDDALMKIIAYLPHKSLVRFTCVCKSWNSLITSSVFITDHLNRTKLSTTNDGKHLIFVKYYPGNHEKERYSLHIDNQNFDQYDVIEFPFLSFGYHEYFRVLGSCNGLICLSDDHGPMINTVFLWNPSIRKCLTLTCPNFTFRTHGPCDHVIGFGFDSRSNDYKVVRIVYVHLEKDQSPRVQLYKLSTGSWETITATVDPSCFIDYKSTTQAFINGAVHWPAFKRDTGDLIMSFNMTDDLFHEMRLPAGVVENALLKKMDVAVCGEWLSFFNYTPDFIYHKSCSVWVMKEYGVVESWSKLYTFHLNGGLERTLGFRRNGEILLAMKNREHVSFLSKKELVSYEPETQQIKYVGFCDSDTNRYNMHSFHVDAYVESLVLLGMQTAAEGTCDNESE